MAAGSTWRAATGPQNPWVRDDWGSLSISRTRRPIWASVPARWCVQLVLPTPPFWFSIVRTGTAAPSGSVPVGRSGCPDTRCIATRRGPGRLRPLPKYRRGGGRHDANRRGSPGRRPRPAPPPGRPEGRTPCPALPARHALQEREPGALPSGRLPKALSGSLPVAGLGPASARVGSGGWGRRRSSSGGTRRVRRGRQRGG